ncbi:recombinase family protein [Mycolicibacterium sp. 050232]|uniref:recombinase family protein n=1 Tax=Mycolicibacterium sp. 050232 TaxID=3113982 RepID=UPI002E2A8DF4|nr:recombinase family protein [Mycolicibacterium sp. 050232]MED5814478.1 recombinase family protein [Mycolicibacterium sp. 050232]
MTPSSSPQKDQVRAGCYLRISSDPKDKRAGVERQRNDTTAVCEAKNWKPVEYYVDNDRSASNGTVRPEWNRLLADIKAGKIDAIAVWNQDRGWRQMSELEDLRKFFEAQDRRILLHASLIGDIDLYDPYAVYSAQNRTSASELESKVLKIRIRRAARAKAESGKPQWRKAFGYLPETRPKEQDDGHREPDPDTAPMVADAYQAILAGTSISDIARDWNAKGKYGLNGNPWSASTMSLFLRAARNAGLRSHNDVVIGKGTWPGLVDESTWHAVQDVLNAPGRAPGRKTVRKHLLTGVMHCGKPGCDGRLAGQWVMLHPTGRKPGRRKAGVPLEPATGQTAHKITYACKKCRGNSIRADFIEPRIYSAVIKRLARPDAVALLNAELSDPAEVEALRTERLALLAQIDQANREYDEGLIDGRRLKGRTAHVSEKLAVLDRSQQDQERLRVFDGLSLGKPEIADEVKALTGDRFRAVIDMIGLTVTIDPVGKGGSAYKAERVTIAFG